MLEVGILITAMRGFFVHAGTVVGTVVEIGPDYVMIKWEHSLRTVFYYNWKEIEHIKKECDIYSTVFSD